MDRIIPDAAWNFDSSMATACVYGHIDDGMPIYGQRFDGDGPCGAVDYLPHAGIDPIGIMFSSVGDGVRLPYDLNGFVEAGQDINSRDLGPSACFMLIF